MANIIDSLKLGDIHGIIALPYGTCSTAAATAAKTVSLTNFVLETGASVRIKFSNANSASTPTLNVNSTGAKNIRWNNANLPSTQYWTANQVIDFVYDGSYWQMIGAAKDNNTNYYHTPSYTSTVSETSTGGSSSNIKIATGTGVSNMYIPVATASAPGATIVYPAASCTTFSSDSGTVTPSAVQKGAKMFAITRPTKMSSSDPYPGTAFTPTDNAILRWDGTDGNVQNSKITIEDVTNTKDTSKKANVLVIPAEDNKKMVYGYCTDQVDGTSFIGGVFPADATEYPYASGLAIGGTSGNLLWKGKQVATTDMITAIPSLSKGTDSNSGTTNLSHGGTFTVMVDTTVNGHVITDKTTTFKLPSETTLSEGTNGTAKKTLSHSGTFTAITDIAVSGHTVTPTVTTFTMPASGNTDTKVKCTSLKTVTSGTETLYPVLMCSTASPTSGTAYEAKYNTGVKISNYGVLMGAAWNDYAEYRSQEEEIEPGYCVKSADNGKVSKTTEKYAACDGIVSDTFGFSIGKTDTCQTPLAVAGRVLAYYEGNREDYHAGDTVCAGPSGKVMKMTREEIKEYPDRIIGLVSEIPEYETWGEGNISVNKRIWIKIK